MMIPRWQMIGMILLALIAMAAEIYLFPNSYAHAYLWGECGKEPAPKACHPIGTRFGTR